jgi:hypothetical protein
VTELPVQRYLLEVIAILDRLGIPYMIMGGFAVRTWGIPRPTYDVDVAVAASEEALGELLRALETGGFDVPEEHKRGWTDSVAGIRKVKAARFEGTTLWDVDLFLVRGSFLESALLRRRSVPFCGEPAWFVAPEDLILLKLIAHRRKDQLDVEEILKVSGGQDLAGLDLGYLRSWAERLGVLERLEGFLGAG